MTKKIIEKITTFITMNWEDIAYIFIRVVIFLAVLYIIRFFHPDINSTHAWLLTRLITK